VLATGAAFAAPGVSFDPATSAGCAQIFRRLAFSSGTKIGFWWLTGTRFALIDATLTPLWDMHVGTIFRVRDVAEGRYDVTSASAIFYTELSSDRFLRRFANPFTGKNVDIAYYPLAPSTLRYDLEGRVPDDSLAARHLVADGKVGPAWTEGDTVWVQGDYHVRNTPPALSLRVNDLSTYFGSLRDVADSAIEMPAAGQTFSDINSWPEWLGMGDRPGNYYSRAYGRKVADYAAMPSLWRSFMAQMHPAIATDPARALG
jgi:hypothetical protein